MGLSNPYELEKLLHKGVEIYNNPMLHAKVFVFPGRAVVGSNNASHTSANDWLEAAIEVSAKGTVAACKKYVKSLCQGSPLGPEYLEDLKELYQAPAPTTLTLKPSMSSVAPGFRLWAVCVEAVEYDRYDKLAARRGMPLAEAELSSRYSAELSSESLSRKGEGEAPAEPQTARKSAKPEPRPPESGASETDSERYFPSEPTYIDKSTYIDTFWTNAAIFRDNVAKHDFVSQVLTNSTVALA